jgi:hypothetical protein
MSDELAQKILMANSIRLPEEDLDDRMVKSQYGLPTEEDALRDYYFQTIIGNIGKEDFKENYLAVMHEIRQEYSMEDQRNLCFGIIKKIEEVYDFSFSTEIALDTVKQIFDIYEFIEFLEYKHEIFISDIWKDLKPDLSKTDLEKYIEQNQDKIINEIENQLKSKDLSELISDFLRTNNKENIIEWFTKKSKPLLVLIRIKIEGENSNV